jgi:hypothetical protein
VTAAQAELPVVIITDVREKRMQGGSSFTPVFQIVRWVPRPPELPAAGLSSAQAKRKPATITDTEIPF